MLKNGPKELIAELYLTENCNMDCRYCFVSKSKKVMSLETAKRTVDFIASQPYENKIICFFGGEPLLEFNLLMKVVHYANKMGIKRFNVCTNGTLLNKKIIAYFNANNIVPMLSIDGMQVAHDTERISKIAKGTFKHIEKKFILLRDFYKADKIQIQITVTPSNIFYLKESVDYLFNMGMNFDINIVPVVANDYRYFWSQEHLNEFRDSIYAISNLFIMAYKKGRIFNISHMCCTPFRDLLNYFNKGHKFKYCFAGTRHLSITVDGNIFPCFYFAGIKNNRRFLLGNIRDGLNSKALFSRELQHCSHKLNNGPVSCPVNNFLLNNSISNPAYIYSQIDEYWERASRYVIATIKK